MSILGAMGLFSTKSSTNQTTNNFDNRVVNDYADATLDYSQTDDNSIDGNLNNNSGTVNMIDAGSLRAIEVAAQGNAAVTQTALDNQLLSFETLTNTVAGTTSDFLKTADNLNLYTIDAAMNAQDNAIASQQIGTDLVLALQSSAADQAADNNDALTSGFEQSMQFIEQFSRSDGAALAQNNTKTIAVIAAAAVAVAFIMVKVK